MKHDIYKLAEQYHLNESEQQMFQSLLEAADQNIQYSVREFAARNYVSPAALIRLSKRWDILVIRIWYIDWDFWYRMR